MPTIEDKNETEEEGMELDTPESEKSEDDDSESGSNSDDDESSDLDEAEGSQRRSEHMYDMADLERQFSHLKEQLYKERMAQVEIKLEEVRSGCAEEYLNPLAQLQENMRIRTQVAGILRELKIQNIKNKYEAEEQAATQNYESEKNLLYDNVRNDLEDKIRHLEEDRHNIDISSDLWNESQTTKRKRRTNVSGGGGGGGHFLSPDRRRKPITVTGPYIVYMLKDVEIIEDWTAIKKALKTVEKKKKEPKLSAVMRADKYPYSARFENGKLHYEGEWYGKGHHIIIDNREDSPVHASVTAINTGEVWVKRADGNKSKLYIAQLQKGKYTIRHVPY